jgi:hypothetical protein
MPSSLDRLAAGALPEGSQLRCRILKYIMHAADTSFEPCGTKPELHLMDVRATGASKCSSQCTRYGRGWDTTGRGRWMGKPRVTTNWLVPAVCDVSVTKRVYHQFRFGGASDYSDILLEGGNGSNERGASWLPLIKSPLSLRRPSTRI